MDKARYGFLHYVYIAVAVAVGAVVGRMIILLVMVEVVEEQVSDFTAQVQESSERIVQDAKEQQDLQREEAKRRRAESKTGKDLLRRCDELTEFHGNHPGEYARQERERACNRYSTYVLTGRT